MEYDAVVRATEEKNVKERCLKSLRSQKKVKLLLVVVNDESADRTDAITLSNTDVIIDLDRHEKSWTGKPEPARVRAQASFS